MDDITLVRYIRVQVANISVKWLREPLSHFSNYEDISNEKKKSCSFRQGAKTLDEETEQKT